MIQQLLVMIVIIATLAILSVVTIAVPSSAAALANKNIQHISSSEYDCSAGANGCSGNVYCDLNDKGSCYDRNGGMMMVVVPTRNPRHTKAVPTHNPLHISSSNR